MIKNKHDTRKQIKKLKSLFTNTEDKFLLHSNLDNISIADFSFQYINQKYVSKKEGTKFKNK